MLRHPSKLDAYMLAVILAGSAAAALAARACAGAVGRMQGGEVVATTLLAAVLVVGELFPIPVARGEEAGDEITVSSTFGLALLLAAPPVFAIAAQLVALVADAAVHPRRWPRVPFNLAQYSLALAATRAVYSALSGQPFVPPAHLAPPALWPSVAAAATFLLVNNTLVGQAIALSTEVRLWRVLRGDLAWQISTSAPLLGLGPLAVVAVVWAPPAIALLVIPILALYTSGRLAMRREQEALRDLLTGLANRSMLEAVATRSLEETTGSVALLLIDLDHFKDINDTLGHGVGDDMLRAVAGRLSEASGVQDLVCRLGGDEFVVLRRGRASTEDARALAERLCRAVQTPVVLEGVTLSVGCSVGIALAPEHAPTLPDLLRCADIALYSAKEQRGTVSVYNRGRDRHSATLLGLPVDLRAALEAGDGQFWVAYQPQYEVATGCVASVECLARWDHPKIGPVPPDVFVPIAESTSLIDLLFHRVLEDALAQLRAWDQQGATLSASVNLSARHLSDLALPTRVAQRLHRGGVDPGRLVLEVTESRLMADPDRSVATLRALKALGVGLSIDDFGTGYSSLSYLQRLAVDELKIDRSFNLDLGEPGNATIVRSTIELGHNLGLRVVAEGVEDLATAASLRSFGCDLLQGYLVGRPMRGADLLGHLDRLPAAMASTVPGTGSVVALRRHPGAHLRPAVGATTGEA